MFEILFAGRQSLLRPTAAVVDGACWAVFDGELKKMIHSGMQAFIQLPEETSRRVLHAADVCSFDEGVVTVDSGQKQATATCLAGGGALRS